MSCIFPCACWPSECLICRNIYKSLLPVFQLECLFLVLPICLSCLYLLEIKPFSVTSFANTFPFHKLSFLLLFFFFLVCVWFPWLYKSLSFSRFYLFIFVLISIALSILHKKTLVQFTSENVLPVIFSRNFIVSCLTLWLSWWLRQ